MNPASVIIFSPHLLSKILYEYKGLSTPSCLAFLKAENAEQLHSQLPNSSLTIFKDCGHFFYQDKSSEFTQLLQSWIKGGYKLD